MNLTATDINYYYVCKRKLWLFSNGINMEHTSDTVYDGKLLHENSYPQRPERHSEIELSAFLPLESFSVPIRLYGKIDFYDARQKIVHETKRSNKVEKAHVWQVKFYLWLLQLNGVEGAVSILEYPLLRLTDSINLSNDDVQHFKQIIQEVIDLKQSQQCPPVINARICKKCSYYDLCYANEL